MNMRKAFGLAVVILLASTCSWAQSINAAGATFPYPIYSKWFDEYHKLHPAVQINYQSIGSGGGISQLQAKTVDFGSAGAEHAAEQRASGRAGRIARGAVTGEVEQTQEVAEGLRAKIGRRHEAEVNLAKGRVGIQQCSQTLLRTERRAQRRVQVDRIETETIGQTADDA